MSVLGLFFTRGVSLENWVDSGLFQREVYLYRRYIEDGYFTKIVWFTYGVEDIDVSRNLLNQGLLPSQIIVVGRPKVFSFLSLGSSLLYSLFLPFVHFTILKKCDVFKTNQMDAVLPAVISSRLFAKPLYLRTGYTFTRVTSKMYSKVSLQRMYSRVVEFIGFYYADVSSVSSEFDFQYLIGRYKFRRAPLLIGNFIDTDLFKPSEESQETYLDRVIYVGRLSKEKNLENALMACKECGLGIDIIGRGVEFESLKIFSAVNQIDVNWLGVVANSDLPIILKKYTFFILPSYWEGLPKSLLEAMSTGLVCIGNSTSGISEIITDGYTGFLSSSPGYLDLSLAIKRAMACEVLEISSSARNFIVDNYSIESIVSKEKAIFNELLANGKR